MCIRDSGQVERGADAGGNLLDARRVEGNPAGRDAKMRVGHVPVEAVEGGAGGRISVLDAQGKAVAANKHGQGEACLLYTSESSATTRASIKAIREAAQSKIAGVLSDGQKIAFALWEKKQERAAAQEESEDMPPPPPDGGNGPPPDGGGGPGGGPGGGGPPGV